jgi:hypothetical protein
LCMGIFGAVVFFAIFLPLPLKNFSDSFNR